MSMLRSSLRRLDSEGSQKSESQRVELIYHGAAGYSHKPNSFLLLFGTAKIKMPLTKPFKKNLALGKNVPGRYRCKKHVIAQPVPMLPVMSVAPCNVASPTLNNSDSGLLAQARCRKSNDANAAKSPAKRALDSHSALKWFRRVWRQDGSVGCSIAHIRFLWDG